MKKAVMIFTVLFIFMMSMSPAAFGAGGKERGAKGQGSTIGGSQGQGQTSQDRTGR